MSRGWSAFAKVDKTILQNAELPFNANEQDRMRKPVLLELALRRQRQAEQHNDTAVAKRSNLRLHRRKSANEQDSASSE